MDVRGSTRRHRQSQSSDLTAALADAIASAVVEEFGICDRGPSSKSLCRDGSGSSRWDAPTRSRRRPRRRSSSGRRFPRYCRRRGGMSQVGGGPNGIRTRV